MKMKARTGAVDPDKSSWKEGDSKSTYFVYVLRVFYEIGQPAQEQLGIVSIF